MEIFKRSPVEWKLRRGLRRKSFNLASIELIALSVIALLILTLPEASAGDVASAEAGGELGLSTVQEGIERGEVSLPEEDMTDRTFPVEPLTVFIVAYLILSLYVYRTRPYRSVVESEGRLHSESDQ